MNPQEKQLLERFLGDMVAARSGPKDPEADALIRDALSRQPDAAYLLVQRAMQLDHVLQIREGEVQKLEAELAEAKAASAAPAGGGSFLGDPYAWGSRPAASAPAAQSPGSAPIPGVQRGPVPPAQPLPQAQAPVPQQPQRGGWGGSGMLGTVATTAAGVVAGSFLYQGIQGLMHRNDPAGDSTHSAAADHHAQPLLGDSSGFDDIVPDDSDVLGSADDDSDLA